MRNRKNALKYRKKIQWEQIAYYLDTKCPKCSQKTVWQVYEYDAKCCILCNEWLDDVLIRKDGIFVLPELEVLNPENLK